MSLRDRLRMLRPTASDRSLPLAEASPGDAAARQVRAGAAVPSAHGSRGDEPLHLGPDVILHPVTSSAGAVLCAENIYPLDHIHGNVPLAGPLHVPDYAWRRLLPVVHGFPIKDAVFLDLETTGLSRGTGTYAFLIGVGRFMDGGFRLRQFFLRDFHEETAAMTALLTELETARALVTFNGRTFDWPLLETRATMNRMRLPRLPHLDLLHPARRLWQGTLDSCRLSRLEEEVLDLHRTDDVPGEEIPQRYFAFLETGDATPLADVVIHNQLDILSMVALAGFMGHAVAEPLSAAPVGRPLSGAELLAIGRLLVENPRDESDTDEGIACLMEALDRQLPVSLRRRCYQVLAKAYKRTGRAEEAAAVLKVAARDDGSSPWAHIELAKHYEHRVGDFAKARDWSLQALEVAMRRRTLGGLRSGQRSGQRSEQRSGQPVARAEGAAPTVQRTDDDRITPRGDSLRGSTVIRRPRGQARVRPHEHDVDGIAHRIRRLERRLRRGPVD